MKVLFAGPSLWDVAAEALRPLVLRGPARQGDILAAVLEGASAIGLVDGLYGTVPAVWHKEILFALERGIPVLGAASMGALRAAECDAFGMVGIGEIYRRYAAGLLHRDDAVAQVHATGDFDYRPLSEALVNVEATLERLTGLGLLDAEQVGRLWRAADGLFFAERNFERIIEAAGFGGAEAQDLLALLQVHRQDLKRLDALVLVEALQGELPRPAVTWTLEQPRLWREIVQEARGKIGALERSF